MRRLLLIVQITILGLVNIQAQNSYRPQFASASIGNSVIDELLPEGIQYTPLTMLGAFSLWNKGKFTLYGEAQLVQAIHGINYQTEYEFGGNLGFMFQQPLVKHLNLQAAIGSGPHYVTIDTRRQANGFIFSDNFELGFRWFIPKIQTTVSLNSRFRHISNAGLQEPNGGIDNLFVVFGIGTIW